MASNPDLFLPHKAKLDEPTADVAEAEFDDSVAVAIGIPFRTTITSITSVATFCDALDAYPFFKLACMIWENTEGRGVAC
jgi:hypothetical protein